MAKLKRAIIFIKSDSTEVLHATRTIVEHLKQIKHDYVFTEETAKYLPDIKAPCVKIQALPKDCDHLIVIGGDGSLLSAAKPAAHQNKPVIGINLGTVGFLTDVSPTDLHGLSEMLSGQYVTEKRALLQAQCTDHAPHYALNDIVISRHAARLLAYDVFIDDAFICSQRSDGLIISTPTGSTAHALSAGGPIIHPQLQALSLVPLCPHRLNSRPIIIPATHKIDLYLTTHTAMQDSVLSCDGLDLGYDSLTHVSISQAHATLKLLHPKHYNYFETLKSKLHWEKSPPLEDNI